MASLSIRITAFFCSYAPLVFIICILQYDRWPIWLLALLAGGLGCGSIALTFIYLAIMRHTNYVEHKKISGFSKHDSDVMGYIASYLVPFVSFQLDVTQQLLAMGLFLAVLLIIYVNSNMLYINPVLNCAGYHLYEVELENSSRARYYIARKPLEVRTEIRFVQLSDDILLEK